MGNLKRPNEFEELPSDVMYLTNTLDSNTHSGHKQAKTKQDAWNAAIRWAAENAKITNISTQHITGCITTQYTIYEQSILNGLIND